MNVANEVFPLPGLIPESADRLPGPATGVDEIEEALDEAESRFEGFPLPMVKTSKAEALRRAGRSFW